MKNSALWRVFIAIALAIVAGLLTGPKTEILDVNLVQLYGALGQVFLNSLKLIVVPLVCSSIVMATAHMGGDKSFKTLGTKSFGYFILTTVLAMFVGYFMMVAVHPGVGQEGVVIQGVIDSSKLQEMQAQADEGAFDKIADLLTRLVPANIVSAAAEGQMLGLIVFCSVFGFFASKIDPKYSAVVLGFFQGVFEIMMKITHLVMRVLPLGVFALVAKVIANSGIEAITSAAAFFVVVVVALGICCFVIFPILIKVIAGVNPFTHFKAMVPALVTAFSTSSSAATMPVTIECLEEGARVPRRVCDFFVPLATAINMPGTALHVCASVFFIAQVHGISFSLATQGIILLMTLLTSFGVAGVPSGSLFAIVTVMAMVGIPAEGVVLILAVERLLDMCRTVTNVYANSCCAVLLAKDEMQEGVAEAAFAAARH